MDIKIIKSLKETGYEYEVDEVVEDAEKIFGPAQAEYLLETGYAEAVKGKTEKASAKKPETADK